MPKVGELGTPSQTLPPRLVNRGPSGLLNKVQPEQLPAAPLRPDRASRERRINKIAESLSALVVDIASLTLDPHNARLHPERNREAIEDSLWQFGQVKPVVVRRQGMVVVAGNGTVAAAKALGWDKIAASVVDMTEVEAACYGYADNRTAELAAWNFENVLRVERLREEAAAPGLIGLTWDELCVLRSELLPVQAPDEFPEVDEGIEIEHVCPKCGYQFSGGQSVGIGGNGDG